MAPGSVPVIGDFNGDHKLDIAFIGTASVQGALAVLLGNGDGKFGATTSYPVAWNAFAIVPGDVNGDAKLDLVVMHAGYLQVFLGNGDGTFRTLPDVHGGEMEMAPSRRRKRFPTVIARLSPISMGMAIWMLQRRLRMGATISATVSTCISATATGLFSHLCIDGHRLWIWISVSETSTATANRIC